jgi:hypothetical protein
MSGLQEKGSIQRQSFTCFGRPDRLTFVGNIRSLYNLRVRKTRAENVHTQLTLVIRLSSDLVRKLYNRPLLTTEQSRSWGEKFGERCISSFTKNSKTGKREVKKGAQNRAKTMPRLVPASRLSYKDYLILHQWRCIRFTTPCRITPSFDSMST